MDIAMKTVAFLAAWSVLVASHCHVAGAEGYANQSILPKHERMDVMINGVVVAQEGDFQWPAKVQKIDGQWLWIVDDGRSRADGRPSEGWVRKSDVILLNGDPIESAYPTAIEYYTSRLQRAHVGVGEMSPSRAFWLRGAAREEAQQYDGAFEDYTDAVCRPCIRNQWYEDEAYAGRARCMFQRTVRANSNVLGQRARISTFRAGDAALPPAANYDEMLYKLETNATYRWLQFVFADFACAIRLHARPRTFVDWADTLSIVDANDSFLRGYLFYPACLPSWDALKQTCGIRNLQLQESDLHAVLTEIQGAEDVPSPCTCDRPIAAGAKAPVSAAFQSVTADMLCKRALQKCRVLERAYLNRGRYYQWRATEAFRRRIDLVAKWRSDRQQQAEEATRKRGEEVTKNDKEAKSLIKRRDELKRDLKLLSKLPQAAELQNRTQEKLAAVMKTIAAERDKVGADEAAPVANDSSLDDRLVELLRDRHEVKQQLMKYQMQRGVEATGECRWMPSDDEVSEIARFYRYWLAALNDFNHAVSVTKENSTHAATAYRVRAALHLMRIDPTGLTAADLYAEHSDAIAARAKQARDPVTGIAGDNPTGISKELDRALYEIHAYTRQDRQLATNGLKFAQQAVKLSEYRGTESLVIYAASLAATADFSGAVRRQTAALSRLDPDRIKSASRLLFAYCAAKKGATDAPSTCPKDGPPAAGDAADAGPACAEETKYANRQRPNGEAALSD
jgi:hypothetical protein